MVLRRSALVFLLILWSLFARSLSAVSVGGVLQRAWAWDGARIVAELDGAGNMTSRFVYGTRPQVPDYMIKGGQVYRILTDHLGSVRLVVRLSDGFIAQELAYDPWGAVEKDTSPGLQPFGFAGGVYDPDTRLVRFGARDYDPATGRWTAKDPSGLSGGTNLYAYADDDPVNLVDLTGEHPVVFLMLAGAMEGIGEDILFQMIVEGKRWGCLDGQELAIAGVMGALSGGLGAPAAEAVSPAARAALPELEISASKYPELAENISHAMRAGRPDVLTHGGNIAANGAAALEGVPNIRGLSRDEFPFASSMEGGAGAWVGHIPLAQQRAQGGLLHGFLQANGILPGMQYRVVIVP